MILIRRDRLSLFLIFVGAALVMSLITGNVQIHSSEREFQPIYLLRRDQAPRKYATSLLVQNSSGESPWSPQGAAGGRRGVQGALLCFSHLHLTPV